MRILAAHSGHFLHARNNWGSRVQQRFAHHYLGSLKAFWNKNIGSPDGDEAKTTKGPTIIEQRPVAKPLLPSLFARTLGRHSRQKSEHEIKTEQLSLLAPRNRSDELGASELGDINTAPLFPYSVLKHAQHLATSTSTPAFSQYGLLAGDTQTLSKASSDDHDPRIFYNVAAPASVFICGSQGSGKSHTLSCILENCLIPSQRLGSLPRPLAGIVFHYDDYASDSRVNPCEAAYLSSDPAVSVRVLCSPTNIRAIKESYSHLENVTVEALRLDQSDLNTKRMMELMVFDRAKPLYASIVQRVLRDMRLAQQDHPGGFNYGEFITRLNKEPLSPDQTRALQQRLETLQSFMVAEHIKPMTQEKKKGKKEKKKKKPKGKKVKAEEEPEEEPEEELEEESKSEPVLAGTNWKPKAGELIIVDLSCPCVTAAMACSLFNICLSIFLQQDSSLGRVVALDEAHRYMSDTSDCEVLTDSLLSAIRYQRHLGVRVIISTQEPTISPKLLDLCNITIVHRFSSPDWLNALTKHLAGISKVSKLSTKVRKMELDSGEGNGARSHEVSVSSEDHIMDLFAQIVELRTGEALVFAPGAIMSLETQGSQTTPKKVAHRVLKVVTRGRITTDGGRSIMAA